MHSERCRSPRAEASPAAQFLATAFSVLLLVLAPACASDRPGAEDQGRIAPVQRDESLNEDRWYVLQLQDRPSGHMHVLTREADGVVTSQTHMVMKIRRGGAVVEIEVNSDSSEKTTGATAAERELKISSSMRLGAQPVTTRYTFKADGVEVQTINGDQTTTETVANPEGDWLTPLQAEREVAHRLKEGRTTITVRTIDPSMALRPLTYTRTIVDRTRIDLLGKQVSAVKWRSTIDAMPGLETTEYVDDEGRMLRTEVQLGGMTFDVIAADKQLALAKVSPQEIMASTLVEIPEPIPQARTAKSGTYRLSIPRGTMPDLPTTGVQASEPVGSDGRAVLVHVDLDQPRDAPRADVDNAAFRGTSSMVNFEDPAIKAMAREALGESPPRDPRERAERLRRFVYRALEDKSLDVGFASASEVARTKSGDCSEHAVILCALLRTADVPARVVSGLVYVDGFANKQQVFGYHMWAQALVPARGEPNDPARARRFVWLDLDPAIDEHESFDATHIALSTSSLADGETINSMVSLVPLLGQLKIEVVKDAPAEKAK